MTLRDAKQALREAVVAARKALAPAWRAQASAAIAVAPHDITVDCIVTEQRTLHVVPRAE